MSFFGRRIRITIWHVFLFLTTGAFATTFVVTNTNTSGPGSLAAAAAAVNSLGSASQIDFNITPGGVQTILVGPPGLKFSNGTVFINGASQPGYNGTPLIELRGNGGGPGIQLLLGNSTFTLTAATIRGLSFGNFTQAILIPAVAQAGGNATITGNYFGIRADGLTPLPNQIGIDVASYTSRLTIGGATAAESNLISNNSLAGILIGNATTAGNQNLIAGNFIGVAADHVTPRPNAIGIDVSRPLSCIAQCANGLATIGGTAPGYANLIAFNSTAGIRVGAAGFPDVALSSRNSIFSNRGGGIIYPFTPLQSAPALFFAESSVSSTTIAGNVTSTSPLQGITLEFFSNPVAEQQGKTYLGSSDVTTDGSGHASFNATVPVAVAGGDWVNATATILVAPQTTFNPALAGGSSTSPFSNDVATTACPAITTQPLSAIICAGQTTTFRAVASGSPTLAYQWQSSPDGGTTWNPITGANSSTYTTGVAGTYEVVVTNGCASPATSNTVTLTVNALPAINTPPSAQTVCAGQPASFTVAATGAGLTYQWQKNTVNISGANGASYTIPVTATTDAGTYTVVVGGTCTPAVTSIGALLTVNTAPAINTRPAAATVCAGQPATFTVGATGAGLTYQWQKNTVNIPGANGASYTIPVTATTDAGTYTVVVGGTCTPAVTSNGALLTVNTAPAINTQPAPVSVCAGKPATFSVGATGAGLTYQWRKGGTPIGGATSSTYTIPTTALSDSGSYDVVVTGTCTPPATSNAAALTVTAPTTTLSLTQFPNPGYAQLPVTFTVVVAGSCTVATGNVTLLNGAAILGSGSLGNGTAAITATLPGPASSLTVQYGGDGTFAAASAAFPVSIGATIPAFDPRILVVLAVVLAAAAFLAIRRM